MEMNVSEKGKNLGITKDRKLLFHQHIKSICKKAGQKLGALLRISPYLKIEKKVIYNTMIKSQFNYCPLVWMFFCSRKSNELANKIQERALRLTYRGNENSFQTLLNENNEASIHQRNQQLLMTETILIKKQPRSTHYVSFILVS